MSVEEGLVFLSEHRYFTLVVVFSEHFICHATETDLKRESAEFQHKSANTFSQTEFHSINLKTIF